jgi:hypothetical protein
MMGKTLTNQNPLPEVVRGRMLHFDHRAAPMQTAYF